MAARTRIAIIGGSIGGCTLANGLLPFSSSIEFDVFESKPTFEERGAQVSIHENAQKAMRAMGMDLDRAFTDSGSMRMSSTYCLAAFGDHKGKLLVRLPEGVHSVARDRWLQVLLKTLPKESLHSSKKLVSISQPGGTEEPYILSFADGTEHKADAVIGCDGARSRIRELILSSDHPDLVAPKFGGYWDARGRLTPQQAADQLGTDLIDPLKPEEAALVGEGAFMLFAPGLDGTIYNVVVSAIAGQNFDQSAWKTELSREFLEESYEDWQPNFRKCVIDALLADGPGVVFSQWESAPAPTYTRDRMCMMGDAAHATIPWLGQGAAMAIEDASVMARLLGEVRSPSDLNSAFKAFNRIRRGRPESVIERSRNAAKLLTGQLGLDPSNTDKLEPAKWWTEVWDIDMDAHIKEAVQCFHDFQNAGS